MGERDARQLSSKFQACVMYLLCYLRIRYDVKQSGDEKIKKLPLRILHLNLLGSPSWFMLKLAMMALKWCETKFKKNRALFWYNRG